MLYVLVCLIFNFFAFADGPCEVKNIQGLYEKIRIEETSSQRKVLKSYHWHPIPKHISIHMGEFSKLKFTKGESLILKFTGKKSKVSKFKLIDKIANVDFTNWFDGVYTYHGGELVFELRDKLDKPICKLRMKIEGGD